MDQGIYDTIILFCIHSLVALLGYDIVNNRIQLLSAHKDLDISSKIFVFVRTSVHTNVHVCVNIYTSMQI
jgi:hypothetical protein